MIFISADKMHHDEVETSAPLIQQLLASQFPQWANLPIAPVPSAGTDNAMYRLGEDLVVRLPRVPSAVDQVHKEHKWLSRLAPRLPLAVPVPLGQGKPGHGYPWHWSVYRWLAGKDATVAPFADPPQAATDLARFVAALHQFEFDEDPPPGRGLHLAIREDPTRKALKALRGTVATEPAAAIWAGALQAPSWEEPPVWIHGDLIATNLLVEEGQLSAIIDFGTLGVGDPACDMVAAWSVLTAETRPIFRALLNVDDATWARGRGWALSQALIILPYYRHTNPGLVAVANRMIKEILGDDQAGR